MHLPNHNWPLPNARENICREEASWALMHMVRYFGIEHALLAETSVEDALLAACQQWTIKGAPKDRSSSLTSIAGRFMIAALRCDSSNTALLQKANALELEDAVLPVLPYHLNIELTELLFQFCDSTLTEQESNMLCLRVLCGFTNKAAACAMLVSEKRAAAIYLSAIKKASKLDKPEIPLELILEDRLAGVLDMINLIFNEGYSLTSCNEEHNDHLCSAAIKLATALVINPLTDRSEVHALLALLYFSNARRKARITPDGEFLMLPDQDRTKWDKEQMNRGWHHFRKSGTAKHPTTFHLEAGIAAQHMVAKHFDDTDWDAVLGYYDALLRIKDTPDVFLNRLLVYGYLHGDEAALVELDKEVGKYMGKTHLYYVVRSELQERCGLSEEAISSLEQAVTLADNDSERDILSKKLSKIKA